MYKRQTVDNLEDYAGIRKFRHGLADKENLLGITTGLAYTDFGGDLLSIEAVTMTGKGRQQITGQLGDVMKESVQAATSYVRSRAVEFGIEPPLFERKDIHVHVPEGATPKDGPSAGAAIAISMISVLTGIPVRCDVAMTGEISLRGRIMPIGGLKEKLLAASRGGIKKVLIPYEGQPFQNSFISFLKNNFSDIKIFGYIHSPPLGVPSNFIRKNDSPDQIILNGKDQLYCFTKILGWKKSSIRIMPSFRFIKGKQKQKNTIFLPLGIKKPEHVIDSLKFLHQNNYINIKKYK